MNTYILMWNPAISSFTMDRMDDYIEMGDEAYDMNWSVYEYQDSHLLDRYFMVRVGSGNTGIMMSGYFSSDPYRDEDWAGRSRTVYYMDIIPDHVMHPERTKILPTATLQQAIPDIDWTGGHSGRLLRPDQAERLEALWQQFLADNCDLDEEDEYGEEGLMAAHPKHEPISVERAIKIVATAFEGKLGLDGRPAMFHSLAIGMMGQTREEQICGLLHDLVQDTSWTFRDLLWRGTDHDIIRALQLLTHEEGTDYFDYVRRIAASGNPLAIAVKKNDLQHNLTRSHAAGHTEQVQKHEQALQILNGVD